MPILEFTGIEESTILKVQNKLIGKLCEVMGSENEDFTLMIEQKKQLTPLYHYVNVRWFDRGQEVQDKCAQIITELIRAEGISSLDVIFHVLERNKYYENGVHF